jgi:hypothetical protein
MRKSGFVWAAMAVLLAVMVLAACNKPKGGTSAQAPSTPVAEKPAGLVKGVPAGEVGQPSGGQGTVAMAPAGTVFELDGLKLGLPIEQVKQGLPKDAGPRMKGNWAVEDKTGVLMLLDMPGGKGELKPGGPPRTPPTMRSFVFSEGKLVAYTREGAPKTASECSDWVKNLTASLGAPGNAVPAFAKDTEFMQRFPAQTGGSLSVWADEVHGAVLGAREMGDAKVVVFFIAEPRHYDGVMAAVVSATQARMRAGAHGAPPPPPK